MGHVLIIAPRWRTQRELARMLPPTAGVRTACGAGDTDGVDVNVVVIGGEAPLTELTEVRAHPELLNKPVVLIAPSETLPKLDWEALNVWLVDAPHDARRVGSHVRQLLVATA